MYLTSIILLTVCIGGGTLACMTNKICVDIDNAAKDKEAANEMEAYCLLQSKAIACFAGDLEGCDNPALLLDPMYSNYYSKCPVTAADVAACVSLATPGCSVLKNAAESSRETSILNYCSSMNAYTQCIGQTKEFCENKKVTVYDVLGGNFGQYELTCNQNDTTTQCRQTMERAGCPSYVQNTQIMLNNQDFNSYCRLVGTYLTCTRTAFQQCDQTLLLNSFQDGYDSSYDTYCSSEATQCQTRIRSSCASIMDQMPTEQSSTSEICRVLSDYFGCVNRTIPDCNATVLQESVVGPLQISYIFQCGTGTDGCSAISTCMTNMQSEAGSSSQTSLNVLDECSQIGEMLSCMDTEFTKCGRPSKRPYTFQDLSQHMVKSCQVLANNTELLTCDFMTVCMSDLPFPTDPLEIIKLYDDPEFWCSLLKIAVNCGTKAPPECGTNQRVLNSILAQTNQLCFPGAVDPTTPGAVDPTTPGAVDPTTPVPGTVNPTTPKSDETASPVSSSSIISAGFLIHLAMLFVLFLQRH